MGIRLNNRKLKPKLAKSVKRKPQIKEAYDEGYRYAINGYKPKFFYLDVKLNISFNKGFRDGLNKTKRK